MRRCRRVKKGGECVEGKRRIFYDLEEVEEVKKNIGKGKEKI